MVAMSLIKTVTGVRSYSGSSVNPVHSSTWWNAKILKPCAVLCNSLISVSVKQFETSH
jgi:hypothetical protein